MMHFYEVEAEQLRVPHWMSSTRAKRLVTNQPYDFRSAPLRCQVAEV